MTATLPPMLTFSTTRPLLALLGAAAALLSSGCNDVPVGTYRVDASAPLAMTCTGVDASRFNFFTDSLSQETFTQLNIGFAEGGDAERAQAQFGRSDGSVLHTDLVRRGEGRFGGSSELASTTVRGADLGGDFSVLLEADNVNCTFDAQVEVDVHVFKDGARFLIDAIVGVQLSRPADQDTPKPCDLTSCDASFDAHGVRASEANPGVYPPIDS